MDVYIALGFEDDANQIEFTLVPDRFYKVGKIDVLREKLIDLKEYIES